MTRDPRTQRVLGTATLLLAAFTALLLVGSATRQQARAEEPSPCASESESESASPSATVIRLEWVLPLPADHEYVSELGRRVIAKAFAMFVARVDKVFSAPGAGEFARLSVVEKLYAPASMSKRKQFLLSSPERGWYGKAGAEFVLAISQRGQTFDPIGRVPLPAKSRDAIIRDLKGYLSIEASGEAPARRKALLIFVTDSIAARRQDKAVLTNAAREFDQLTVEYASLFSRTEFDRIQPVMAVTADKEAYGAMKRGLEAILRTGVATELIRDVQRAALPGPAAALVRTAAETLVRGFGETDFELLDRIAPSIRDEAARTDCEAALAAIRKSLGK